MSARHRLALRDSATEQDCLRVVDAGADADIAAYFRALTLAWQRAAYAGRLPDDATGEYVVAEYFRESEAPVFGIAFDGGFAMGANLPLFTDAELGRATRQVQGADGEIVEIPNQATVGEISSGGLY